jgi:hypothetical protein
VHQKHKLKILLVITFVTGDELLVVGAFIGLVLLYSDYVFRGMRNIFKPDLTEAQLNYFRVVLTESEKNKITKIPYALLDALGGDFKGLTNMSPEGLYERLIGGPYKYKEINRYYCILRAHEVKLF